MKTVMHKANSRGHANHGWLDTHHTFSFADYYEPSRMNFGVLRVLNDDVVAPGMGFGMHPHKNMEIISIPLEGDLEHKDSMGNTMVIRKGDIQVMSAGTGIYHSEYNKNTDSDVKFLQIWIIPNKQDVVPRYDQISIANISPENNLKQILSPNKEDEGVWIYQNAWFYYSNVEEGDNINYHLNNDNNGIYIFLITGNVQIDNEVLTDRDGICITDTNTIYIEVLKYSELLIMEVPPL